MTIEMLERRAMLSVAVSSGLLTINGTATGDAVSVTQSGTTLTVVDNKIKSTYAVGTLKSIKVMLGSGADSATIGNTVLLPATVTAGSGNDTLVGGGGATSLVAGAGSDSLQAGSGATTLTAGGGSEILVGGGGTDTYVFGAASVTPLTPVGQVVYLIRPGAGVSNLNFSGLPSSVTVNVDLTNDLAVAKFAGRTVATAGTGQAARFTGVVGNGGDDTFIANSANDSIVAGAGANTITAGNGNDTLSGAGDSTEYIFEPQSSPVHYVLNQAVGGTNILNFQTLPAGNDLTLNLNYDLMAAYDNVTISDGKAGQFVNFNEILEGQGDDLITFNNAGDSLLGGSGYDTIFGGTGADLMFLGNGYDVVSGDGGADTVFGGSGNYVIYATNYLSDPSLVSPTAKPPAKAPAVANGIQVFAGTGAASIVGSTGDDTLEGSGADTIHGMGGNDYISGGGGGAQSVLFGDGGNDTIYAGLGDTTISGGGGQDSITAGSAGGANDFIDNNIPDNSSTSGGGAVIDSVALTANAIAADQGLATPTYPLLGTAGVVSDIDGASANMTVIGGVGDDNIQGGDGPASIVGGSGSELLTAGFGNDVVQGGAGDDTIVAGFGNDLLQGGSGNTTFFNVNGFADTVIGGSGFNTAQADPTGQSILQNIQIIYSPDSTTLSSPPPVLPAITGLVNALAKPAATANIPGPAIPAPSVSGGVLTVGSRTATTVQNIAVSQAGSVITAVEIGVGTFTFSSTAVTRVVVYGGPGDDTCNFNTLLVPASCSLGNGNNYAIGGTGNETMTGGSGNDTLIGGPGANVISGGNGTNVMYGGTGSDTITGGTGFDYIIAGGYGVSIPNNTEADSIKGGTGTETLYMTGNADPIVARLDLGIITDQTTGVVTHVSGIKNFYAGPGNSLIITPPRVSTFAVNGGSGIDTIYGTGPRSILYGGIGTPTVYANSSGALIDLAGTTAGQVAYYGRLNATDSLDAGLGQDILVPLVAAP